MPRPVKPRFVAGAPTIAGFAPKGAAPRGQVILTVEGFEALRLSDFEHLDQATAAEIMGVSRQTYGRILGQARSLVCDALVTGKEILIDGGHFELRGRGWARGRGGGRGRGQGGGRGHRSRREVTDMPEKDGTGPGGQKDNQGSGTGRGRGGRGQGAGRGGGAGQRTGQGAGRGRGQSSGGGRGGGGQGGGRRNR